jgi:hypothetical protein
MLQRLDAMESELSALIESLRTGSNRLNADLQLLEGNLGEVRDAVAPRPRFEPEAGQPVAEAAVAEAPAEDDLFEEQAEREGAAEAYDESIAEEPVSSVAAGPADGSDDTEGARLIALNMALNGTPREETDRYLAENFQLTDRRGLLDEVYASVEG